jgi:hypothetical protein
MDQKTGDDGNENPILRYPKHKFNPKEWLGFLNHPGFTQDWDSLPLSSDDLLVAQTLIMTDPKGHRVIPGTGGLRELAVTREDEEDANDKMLFWVYFVYFEESGSVLLVMVSDEPVEFNATLRRMIEKEISEQEKEAQDNSIKFKNAKRK